MPMRLKQLTYEEFTAEGLSPTTARFLTASSHPIPNFDIFVRPVNPRWDYWSPDEVANVVGLWDENADPYCRWTRRGTIEFVHIYHDEPGFRVVAESEQGILAYLFEEYYEFVDWHNESEACQEVRKFGDYIGFKGTGELVRLLDYYARNSDREQYERSRAELIRSL